MAIQRNSRPPVIRLFPDNAGTVLWLSDPVDYAQTALSARLVTALQEWEHDYNSSLNEDHAFRTKELAKAYTAEGNRLAGLVAAEVGSGFAVEFSSYERWSRRRYFNSPMPATNLAAATCFAALLEADDAEAERLAALVEEGGLYFHSTSTGADFPAREERDTKRHQPDHHVTENQK